MKRRGMLAAVSAVALVALTACGSGGGGGNSASGNGKPEKTDVTVGVLPIADYAAVYWAQDKGFFKNEGLNVTLKPVQAGPIATQNVATGQLDFSISNTISTSIATQTGLPVKTVVLTSALGPGGLAVYVKPDSPIRTLKDLNGKTIGINATKNIGDVTLRNLLDSEGLKDVKPKFVEVPFPEMLAGVQAGSIDVGYSPEPFSAAALAAGMRQIVDLADPKGPNAGLAVSNFIASDSFIQANPNTVNAFIRAMYKAGGDITAHQDAFRQFLPGVARVAADVAQQMPLPQFFTATKVDQIQRVVDLLVGQGLLKKGYDATKYTYIPRSA